MNLSGLPETELQKARELVKMKYLATGLLALMAGIFVTSRYFHGEFFWLGFIEATAEAAMVGALADWFAVTALFRYPMGIKIPHTAIIPNRKDKIAEQFGEFVQQNFLSEEVISRKVQSMDLSRRVAKWITQPGEDKKTNAEAIGEQIAAGIAGIVRVMNDKDIQALIEQKIETRIRETSFAPIIGDLLTFITSGRRQQALFDTFVDVGLNLLEDSDTEIRQTVEKETPWWFPGSLDRAIYNKIVRSVSRTLYEMQTDIYHPLRVRMLRMSSEFMENLKHSDDIRKKEISIKEELLSAPALRNFTGTLWQDIKTALLNQSENPDSELKKTIENAVTGFGQSILEDEKLADKINGWADDSAKYLIRTYGHEVSELISQTIESWDPNAASERIELQIGKDLQFIRINGTVVGGLVGLTIYTASFLPLWLGF